MKKKNDKDGLNPEGEPEAVEVVDKGPCQDCFRTDWEYAHRDSDGNFNKCDKCHYWNHNEKAMRPRVIH